MLGIMLDAENFKIVESTSGKQAVRMCVSTKPDLILLDLGLPDMDGKDVIKRIRAASEVPIIVISARHQEAEKITALDNGADDYVNKPFEIGELMARIRAAIRRGNSLESEPEAYRGGPLEIDFVGRHVRLDGEPVRLSRKEYDLLRALALSAGQVVTHKRLLAAGWGSEGADSQYLRVYVGLLRQKIEEDPSDPRLLITEPGVGYRLTPGVREG
ncbi:MAG: response regulator transcription factor [Sphingobium limneticum]